MCTTQVVYDAHNYLISNNTLLILYHVYGQVVYDADNYLISKTR
jgi:hypothetical protein